MLPAESLTVISVGLGEVPALDVDSDRLGALVGGAQAARIDHGGVGIVRIGAVARARGFERLPPMLTPLRQENKTDIMGRIEVLRRTHAKAN